MTKAVCEFKDAEGPVAFLAEDIRRIYRIPEANADNPGELTVIEVVPVDPATATADDHWFSVSTPVMEAIAEWKRGLARMQGG